MRKSITYTSLSVLVLVSSTNQVPVFEASPLTSVVVHSELRRPREIPKVAKVLFVGDMMFDRQIRQIATQKGYEYIFSCVADDLAHYDAVIGNLEGPVTKYPSVSMRTKVGDPRNTQFTFSPEIVPVLAKMGFKAVSLGNNHIRDFGREGALSSASMLTEGGINVAGVPDASSYDATTITVNGVSLTLVPYNQFLGNKESVFNALATIPSEELVVVFPHWGNEYVPATAAQKELAKKFVAAGADAVIGAHPHVVQESEMLGTAPVYYSLGNFIFDQYWNDAVRTGKGVVLTITENGITEVSERTFMMQQDGRTCATDVANIFPEIEKTPELP